MIENRSKFKMNYDDEGYFVVRDYLAPTEISALRKVILSFHEAWIEENKKFYKEVAFNSSLITGSEYLSAEKRIELFNFISSPKLMALIESVIPVNPAFMNTQLFFNPVNPELKDFWHRDCQYDFSIEEQKKAIIEHQVVHLRVPLFDEFGMELIPGTHKRWDSEEELNVRQEEQGRLSCEDLPGGKKIPLSAGDMLIFSADMIHRGLYGMDRLALDILVFDPSGDFADYVDNDCLPELAMLEQIEDPRLFMTTLQLKSLI